jgi:hypothetical protein
MNTTLEPVTIGAPVYNPAGGRIGHVCEVTPAPTTYTIGAGGVTKDRCGVVIVWDDFTMTECGDGIAQLWLDQAAERRISPLDCDASERLFRARQRRAEVWDTRKAEQDAAHLARLAYEAEVVGKIPSWAKAVIVAELIEDKSDSMSDYYGSTTKRTVILGFSPHTRDLFPELRKAARNFPETAHLADAPADAEHREKYSMGGGYYLKKGGRHWSGWQVSKERFWDGDPVKRIPMGDWFTGAPATPAPVATGGSFTIEKHAHSKKGFDMWICTMAERVERAEYDRLNDAARNLGGWYSRPWGKTPGGFAFKREADALAFANASPSEAATPAADDTKPAPMRAGNGDKLRAIADGMQRDINGAFRDRLANTPKRQRQAQSARLEGLQMTRAQAGLRALAALADAGTIPPALAHVTSRKAAHDLARAEIKRSGGYYDAGHETGKPGQDTEAARLLWALAADAGKAEREAFALRQKIEALQFARIPGYFPTPRAVALQMLDLADMPDGPCHVLEPSAGHGALVDVVREAHPLATIEACEQWHSLREILKEKGVTLAGDDFTEFCPDRQYNRVVMNPPFENGQDARHVMLAHSMLAPGGVLISVMSPGPFFRSDATSIRFREWFDSMGGEKIDLPAGSFKESGTGVGAVLVRIGRA